MGLFAKYIGNGQNGSLAKNFDKRMHGNDSERSHSEMPIRFRQTYSYRDRLGNIRSIRIEGRDRQQTDLKFQSFVLGDRQTDMTLGEFIDQIYRPSFIANLSPTTISNYEGYLRYNILPFFGGKEMRDITVADIQAFYNWMGSGEEHGRRTNLTERSIDRIGGFLGRIFKVAVEMHLIDDSPVKKTLLRNPGTESVHHVALSDLDVDQVKSAIPSLVDPREKVYAALLVYTGLRREEIVGLKWEDMNFEEEYGRVNRVVVYPDNQQPIIKNKPKTPYSERSFILPRDLLEILSQYRQESGFILFGKTPDLPMSYSTLKRTYTNAFRHLGISDHNNHDWRATYGTQLKEFGISSAQVADLLGHADTRMVETVYARARHEGIMKHKDAVNRISARR